MPLIILKIFLVVTVYAVIFYFILRKRKMNILAANRSNNKDNNDDGGGEAKPDDFPTLDLPPGVYILPPGATDPSTRRPDEKYKNNFL